MMTNTFWVCFALCVAGHRVTAGCCQTDEVELPPCLDRPINASIAAINIMLDDAQYGIHTKQKLTIPVVLEMNRAIGEGGPIVELLTVGENVYTRFLTTVDTTSSTISCNVTRQFKKAVRQVEENLRDLLPPCEVEKVIAKIECLIGGIEDHIADLTAGNQDRYWGLYGELSTKLVGLHSTKCSCKDDYNNRLEGILKSGSGNFNRFINDVGNRVERYLAGIGKKIREIIKEALQPKCRQQTVVVDEVAEDSYSEEVASK